MPSLQKFLCRFKHPRSLPEEIGKDLGVQILYNQISFQECIDYLTSPEHRSKNLKKFMPRKEAEEKFHFARRKERFKNNSLFSYHIYHGWLAFDLVFDENDRLRRVYMQHQHLEGASDEGIEIPLNT